VANWQNYKPAYSCRESSLCTIEVGDKTLLGVADGSLALQYGLQIPALVTAGISGIPASRSHNHTLPVHGTAARSSTNSTNSPYQTLRIAHSMSSSSGSPFSMPSSLPPSSSTSPSSIPPSSIPPSSIRSSPIPFNLDAPRPFVCKLCYAAFHRYHDLKRHMDVHCGTKPYMCHCGRAFTRKDALKRHSFLKNCPKDKDEANRL
jgi:hypothetical protein